MNVYVSSLQGRLSCVTINPTSTGTSLKQFLCGAEGVSSEDLVVTHHGRIVQQEDTIQPGGVYRVWPRLVGGKGGFGSMLRAIGAQIEKTTNHEACRDLSGRRMRDVNDEKRLQEWLGKKAEREREREEEKRRKREERMGRNKHFFNDPEYEKQKRQIMEGMSDSLQKGLEKAGPSGSGAAAASGGAQKRKAGPASSGTKKLCTWVGLEGMDDLDSLDSDSDDEESARPVGAAAAYYDFSSSGGGSSDQFRSQQSKGKASASASSASAAAGSASAAASSSTEDSSTSSSEAIYEKDMSSSSKEACETDIKKPDLEPRSGSSDGEAGKQRPGLLQELSPPKNESLDTSNRKEGDKLESKIEVEPEAVDLSEYSTAGELESLGLDRLKGGLMALGLKCGGTLQERASRLFSVKGLERHQYDPSLLAKPSKGKGKKKQ
ncbi:SDE2 [Branchiostoma lanceolatum]|uniref:SDE2 protein n=1 Tax=Branchiostoma lanceolatum TaxID=7740 RepID=A0A8K0EUW4_BRALA|nr:SDE2 [Branchiostoma lanceolatum]